MGQAGFGGSRLPDALSATVARVMGEAQPRSPSHWCDSAVPHPIASDTSSIRPLYQSPPLPAFAPIESWAVLSIRPMVVVDV